MVRTESARPLPQEMQVQNPGTNLSKRVSKHAKLSQLAYEEFISSKHAMLGHPQGKTI